MTADTMWRNLLQGTQRFINLVDNHSHFTINFHALYLYSSSPLALFLPYFIMGPKDELMQIMYVTASTYIV